MKKYIAIVGLLTCGSVMAAEGLSYNHVQLDFVTDSDLDVVLPGIGTGSTDGDGFDLSGVFSVTDTWFVKGNYESLEYDGGLDLDFISAGVGGHTNAFTGAVDVFGVISYESIDAGSGADDDGFGLEVGASVPVSDKIDIGGSYQIISFDDLDGDVFRLGGGYALTPQWAVRVDYLTGEYEDGGNELERDDLSVGVRYNF